MQGQGIGGRILEELEQRARSAGARRIVLNARNRAVDFYRQHGYSITHESEVLFNAIHTERCRSTSRLRLTHKLAACCHHCFKRKIDRFLVIALSDESRR